MATAIVKPPMDHSAGPCIINSTVNEFIPYRELYLREDVVTEGYCADVMLKNAEKTCEGYYVAPPGKNNFAYKIHVHARYDYNKFM